MANNVPKPFVRNIAEVTTAVATGDLTIEGGRQAWQLLSEQRRAPTAIFCANDLMALGVLCGCSPAATPFFVPPKLRISTPAFQVIVFGAQPSDATALAKRAPSI